MKNIILILVLSIFSLNSFAQKKPKIKGDKNVVTTTNNILKGFNTIEVDDALEVTLSQSNQNNYTLTTGYANKNYRKS